MIGASIGDIAVHFWRSGVGLGLKYPRVRSD